MINLNASGDDYQNVIRELAADLGTEKLKVQTLARTVVEKDAEIEALKTAAVPITDEQE